MNGQAALALAALAAVIATAGDLLLLWVANDARPALGLATPPPGALALGGALGVLAIPLYAVGYAGAARLVAPVAPVEAAWIRRTGLGVALLGAFIHGWTAHLIGRGQDAGMGGAPLEGLAAGGPLLLGSWAVASLLVLAASVAFWRGARAAGAGPALGLVNPAMLTVALVAASFLLGEAGRSFVAPAAPNLAHVAFFAVAAAAATRTWGAIQPAVGRNASISSLQ